MKRKFLIGRHISTSDGFLSAVPYAHKIGCGIIQIFLGPPQIVTIKQKSVTDLEKFGLELKKYNIQLVVHGSYAINLCHPPNSARYKASVSALIKDLEAVNVINSKCDLCLGVIIHMGKNIAANNLSNEQAINNYVFGLKESLKKTQYKSTIILETGASQGSEVASTIDGLGKIYWSLTNDEQSKIKFCIDTCHIWATGYDISTAAGVKSFFQTFNKVIGINKICCIHFNDSRQPVNSHVDRHADLDFGYIKSQGLKAVAIFALKHNIPLLMETPLESIKPSTSHEITFKDELNLIKSWIK